MQPYGLEEENSKSEVFFAVCRLPLTSCLTSLLRKNYTVPFLKYKRLKLKLRVFLAGYTVAVVTNSVMKMITTGLPMIRQFFDTVIVASIDNEW